MILVPVASSASISRRPVVTFSLIAVNTLLWLATAFAPGPRSALDRYDKVVASLERTYAMPFEDRILFELRLARGLVVSKRSAEYRAWRESRREAEASLAGLDEWLVQKAGFVPERGFDHRLVTSLFVHGGFTHLLMNMLFLFLVGCNVEDAWGRLRFFLFYVAGGVAANLAHFASEPAGEAPLVGASGAVSAVMAAFVVFHATTRIRFFWWFILFGFFEVPAFVAIAGWFILQIVNVVGGYETVVAYWAHIGGFAFGLVVSIPIRLLRGPVRPRAPEPRAPGGATQQVAIPGTASLGNEWMTGGALRDAEEELTDGAPTKAAELFEKIIVADPRNLDARWGLVRAYRAQGRTKEALALGERLIADLASAGRNEDARRVYALLMS